MTWEGKSRGNVAGYRFFVFLLRNLGLKFTYHFLKIIIAYYMLFAARSSGALFRFYRYRLRFGLGKSFCYIYKNYYRFGQTLIDKIAVMGGLEHKFSLEHEGLDYLKTIAESGSGGVFISAHLGNYEMAGHLLKGMDVPVNLVIFDGEQEQIKAYLASVYGQKQVKVIAIKNDLSHIIAIHEAIRSKEVICILADRFIPGAKTFSAPFLGKPALFPAGPFSIAKKLNVPYSFVFALKDKDTHYHFFATPPKLPQGKPEDILLDFVAELETKVKRYPDHWFNFFDFWNTNANQSQEKDPGPVLHTDRTA